LLSSKFNEYFFSDADDSVQEIASMPGVFRFGVNKLEGFLEPLVKDGLKSVLLFGVPQNLPKVLPKFTKLTY